MSGYLEYTVPQMACKQFGRNMSNLVRPKKPFWSTRFQQASAVKGLSAVEGLKISEVALETSEDWYSFYSNHGS